MFNYLKFFGISLIAAFGLFFASTVFATETSAAEFDNDGVEEVVAEFDLNKNEAQETTFINENGEQVTVGIIPVESDEISALSTSTHPIKLGNSSFKAYWYTAAINMSYYIDINRTSTSTRITNARDLYVLGVGYSISRDYWGFSSSKASFEGTATMYGGLLSLNVYLTSTVSGSTLTIKAKA